MEIIFNAAGGLALFMLAMSMMTDGLKTYAGSGLKNLLQNWTTKTWKGVLSGVFVTGFVQSSSAVTVATIGFVNAGMLTLTQALNVIFGTNIGTTMTGWLVSLTGFGFKIETIVMPMLAVGVVLRFIASEKRYGGLGNAIIGFALFFLGLSILKDAFSSVTETFGPEVFSNGYFNGLPIFVLGGFLATVLTQSSSAAIAVILMAASEFIIGIDAAAAAIIGANIGTTSTAVFAVFAATPNAKRVAAGHVAFNLITGIVALALLPFVLWIVGITGHWLGIGDNPVPFLAFFHTVFNILGVLIILPFAGRLSRFLKNKFVTEAESLSQPKFLDKNISTTPELAIPALYSELSRLSELVCSLVLSSVKGQRVKANIIEQNSKAIYALAQTIEEFATHIRMKDISREIAEEIPRSLRVGRYLEEASRFSPEVNTLWRETEKLKDTEASKLIKTVLSTVEEMVKAFEGKEELKTYRQGLLKSLEEFQAAYQEAKAGILKSAVEQRMSIDQEDRILDSLSHIRRMIEQMTKADRILRDYNNVEQSQK